MVNYLQALLSGILLFLGFAPFEYWIAPFLGIALLFRVLSEKDFGLRFSLALISGLGFFLPLLHWSSTYVGSIPWLVLATGQSLIFAAIALPRWRLTIVSAIGFAAIFNLVEILRMKAPFGGFGWGRVGFTQLSSLGMVYPLVGVTGVSLIVALASVASLSKLRIVISLLLITASALMGQLISQEDNDKDTLQITAIQGGVDRLGFEFNDRALRVLERHIAATKTVSNTRLYIWPENASDVDPFKNQEANSLIGDLVMTLNAPLLIGAVEQSPQGPQNSSLLIDTSVRLVSRYIKQDLAPFGEYMPVRKLSESVSSYAKQVTDFVSGERWIRHSIDGKTFQSLICFEILDDDHAKAGLKGVAFAVAQTNNATFGRSTEAAQQLQITRSRAAESGRDFAVVSTTGYTAHIDSTGKTLATAPQFAQTELTMQVALAHEDKETPAQKLNSGIWVVALLGLYLFSRMGLSR